MTNIIQLLLFRNFSLKNVVRLQTSEVEELPPSLERPDRAKRLTGSKKKLLKTNTVSFIGIDYIV